MVPPSPPRADWPGRWGANSPGLNTQRVPRRAANIARCWVDRNKGTGRQNGHGRGPQNLLG